MDKELENQLLSNDGIEIPTNMEVGGQQQQPEAEKAEQPEGEQPEGEQPEGEQPEGEQPEGEQPEGEAEKPKKTPRDHQIERLKREKAELARQLRENDTNRLIQRIDEFEKRLQGNSQGDNQANGNPAPDPLDAKYPLGHLDDRYIEDKLEWLAEVKANERAEAVLRRQQEIEQQHQIETHTQQLLEKADDLTHRGSDIYDDFEEFVVESGKRGDWDLDQPTFEAAHEAEHGAQILYELAQNPKEAARVAKLSVYQQVTFVQQRDAEIRQGKSARRIPQAGQPPVNPARGATSKTLVNPATDDLEEFAKMFEREARKKFG